MDDRIAWVDEDTSLDTVEWVDENPGYESVAIEKQKNFLFDVFKGALKNTATQFQTALPPVKQAYTLLQEIERPVAGLRAISKEGPKSFMKGVLSPEKYPVGTFGEALANAGIEPTAAGALGTLADVGAYFAVPEAIGRLVTAGKIKLLEETIGNVNKALKAAGENRTGVVEISEDALKNAAKNKDILNITRDFLRSKGFKVSKESNLMIEEKSFIDTNAKAIAEKLKQNTTLRPDIIKSISHDIAEQRISGEVNPVIENALDNPSTLKENIKLFEEEVGDKITIEPIIPEATPKEGGEIVTWLSKGAVAELPAVHTGERIYAIQPKDINKLELSKETLPKQYYKYKGLSGKEIIAEGETPQEVAKLLRERGIKPSEVYFHTGKLSPKEGGGVTQTKTRGLSSGVEAKAIENKLVKSLGDLPEYKTINMKDQAAKAKDILTNDYELAKNIALRKTPAPDGILPESIFVAVENQAIKEGDVDLIRKLATSGLTEEATAMGQRIRTLAERDPESPVTAIKSVIDTRKSKYGKRADLVKKETVKNIKDEIKKISPTKETWESFIKSIQC